MRQPAVAVVLAVFLLVTGCGVERLLERGDRAMQAGRAGEAVVFYTEAFAKEPKLADDPQFMATLTRAKSRAAYEAGRILADRGDWEAAAQRFRDSLQIDPNFQDARTALAEANRQAAVLHHKKALDLADRGRLDEAGEELKRALEFNPASRDARAAMDSVTTGRDDTTSPDGRLFHQALAHAQQKQWGEAAESFRDALKANPNHLPARAELDHATRLLQQARKVYADAARLLDQKRLDGAIAAAKQALDIWPTCPEAQTILKQAESRRKEIEDLYNQAATAADKSNWHDAVLHAGAALEGFPAHPGARDVLARSAFALGQADEGRSRWGAALLWYMDAADHSPNPKFAERRRAMEAKVRERITFAVVLEEPKSDVGLAAVADLRNRILVSLDAERGRLVRIAGTGDAQAAYAASIRLTELRTSARLVRTENRAHPYTVGREIPNPEIPRLHHILLAERARLARMQRLFNTPCAGCKGRGRITCPTCKGTGVEACTDCQGTGRIICSTCNGSGTVGGNPCGTCNSAGKVNCGTCGGSGSVDCSYCSTRKMPRRGWVNCPRCFGTGRAAKISQADIDRQESRVRRLQTQILHQPPTLIEEILAQWPYTVEFHEKTGLAEARIEVKRQSDGSLVRADAVRSESHAEDATTVNPNPGIGLPPDPLALPADRQIEHSLIDAVAAEVAGNILDTVAGDVEAQVRAAVERFRREGNKEETVEAGVDLALLLRGRNAAEADRIFADLRAGQRRR